MGKYVDLTGARFGRLRVLEKTYITNGKGKRYVAWVCQCDCGNKTTVYSNALLSGATISCGCYNSEKSTKHGNKKNGTGNNGARGTRLYRIWLAMRARCHNPNRPEYKDYGGRGICVCSEWNDFRNFLAWAETSGYADNLTIDREDNNGNYCPENCRWATYKEQGANKRNSVKITAFGQTHSAEEWSKLTGIPETAIRHRVHYNWRPEDIVSKPVQAGHRKEIAV